MKRTILFILFVSIRLISYGQHYNSLLKEGNVWNVMIENSPGVLKCGKSAVNQSIRTFVYKLTSDTIVNEIKYKKLFYTADSLSEIWILNSLIREDTIKRKVYYLDTDLGACTQCGERLLYDFDLKINDKFYYTEGQDTIMKYSVFNVDSVLIDKVRHKRISLSYGLTWIEGIGDTAGLVSIIVDRLVCMRIDLKLLCFYNNDKLIYHQQIPYYDNCFYWIKKYSSVLNSNTQFDNYKLFPNPAHSILNVSSDNLDNYTIELINMQGDLILKKENLNNDSQIDIENVNNGFYFVKIYNKNNSFTYKMIIK